MALLSGECPRLLALASGECKEQLHNAVTRDLHRKCPGALPPWASELKCFQDGCGDVAVHVCVDRLHSLMEHAMNVLNSRKDQLQFGQQAPLLSSDQFRSILPGVDGVHAHLQEGVADYYMQLLAQLNGSFLLRAASDQGSDPA